MAKLVAHAPLVMDERESYATEMPEFSARRLVFANDEYVWAWTGRGFRVDEHGVLRGRATSYETERDGAPYATVTGLKVDLETYDERYVDGGAKAAAAYVLRGDDTLTGSSGRDVLRGYGGDDTTKGRGGGDVLQGGGGADRLMGGAGDDVVRGGKGDDRALGGKGRDRLKGDAGDDELGGGTGRDQLKGGSGDDVLDGGKGRDTLTGGKGADTFVFSVGRDVVRDFAAGKDVLDLRGVEGLEVWKDVRDAARERGDELVLDFDEGRLVLKGVELADLGADDVLL